MGYLSRNVATMVDMPAAERQPIVPLTMEEALRFLAACKKAPSSSIVNLLAAGLLLGKRTYSELAGASQTALDMERGTLELDRVLIQHVKTAKGYTRKLIPAGNSKHKRVLLEIPRRLMPLLKRQVKWLRKEWGEKGLEWNPERLLFPDPDGKTIAYSTYFTRFKALLAVAGLPETTRPHDLRHSCASLLIADGASVKTVQAVLGHSTSRQTLDTYSHLFPGAVRAALDGVWSERTEARREAQ